MAMTQQDRIDEETIRRANEGDFSDYVKGQLAGEDGIGAAERLGIDRPQEASTPAWKNEPQNQGTALNLMNQLSSTPSWQDLLGMKEQLVGIPAITTDEDENRNMYQYLINEMLRAGKNPRGAQLLDVSQIPLTDEGDPWRRTGGTTFTDPTNPSFGRDLAGLFSGENTGVFNLKDQDNKGLAAIADFQPNWAQDELGITDWGELMEGLITGATPFKYAKMAADYMKDSAPYQKAHQLGVLGLETAVKPVNFLTEQIEALRKKLTE